MRIGIVSDLHFEFWRFEKDRLRIIEKINEKKHDIDYIVIAGDFHPNPHIRQQYLDMIEVPYIFVCGNHDYYGRVLESHHYEKDNFVVASLWTNFWDNPIYAEDCRRGISDFYQIAKAKVGEEAYEYITPQDMIDLHNQHKKFIFDSDKELVVTHFPPASGSLAAGYRGHPMNPYFVNMMDSEIYESKKKLWVHGHVHGKFDYQVGPCKIVCNPLGYPREIWSDVEEYQIKVVSI